MYTTDDHSTGTVVGNDVQLRNMSTSGHSHHQPTSLTFLTEVMFSLPFVCLFASRNIFFKVMGGSNFHKIWGISKVWTTEVLTNFWKWSGTYFGHRGRHFITPRLLDYAPNGSLGTAAALVLNTSQELSKCWDGGQYKQESQHLLTGQRAANFRRDLGAM